MLVEHANEGDNMTEYFITDDCGYDDGTRYTSLEAARAARQAVLAEIGTHMGDWTHVGIVGTDEIVREPGAWVLRMDDARHNVDNKDCVLHYDASDEDAAWRHYDMGNTPHKPVWDATYEWN